MGKQTCAATEPRACANVGTGKTPEPEALFSAEALAVSGTPKNVFAKENGEEEKPES
jgi:hypothetical protein